MAVINPRHLLEQADLLLHQKDARGIVRQANRRRAISNAYYAVFHLIVTAAADELVGRENRRLPHYSMVYRRVEHSKLEQFCNEISGERPSRRYIRYAPEGGFGEHVRTFAILLAELKGKRNEADYDPSKWMRIADARAAIDAAREAIASFRNASSEARNAFLTLLLLPPQ